jgi:hypothetical protein
MDYVHKSEKFYSLANNDFINIFIAFFVTTQILTN